VARLKPEEVESRRREIIDAAKICFLRSGFHRTTTDEICREASITPGGLYHYFSGKEAIISAVIQQSTDDVVDQLRTMIDTSADSASAFQEIAQFFLQMWRSPGLDDEVRLDIEIWAEALKSDVLNQISGESWAMRRQVLEDMIRRNAADGLFNTTDVDARGFSSLLIATGVGLRIANLLWKDDFDLNGAIASLFLVHSGRLVITMPEIPALPVTQVDRAVNGKRAQAGRLHRQADQKRSSVAKAKA